MGYNVAELEIQIKKTAFPEIWIDNSKVVCRLVDYLTEIGEIKAVAFPEKWMKNQKSINRLVQYLEKKVENGYSHLSDIPIEVYLVFYNEISPETLESIRNHLKKCKTCLPHLKKDYEKYMWGDLEQTKNAVEEIERLASEITKKGKL